MKRIKQITVLLCLFTLSVNASLIGDFLAGAKNFWPKSKDLSVESKLKDLPNVQFELPVDNEEFLKEGLALLDAPREGLDLCTHRVVHTLKTDCNKLNLEEIGKLAVMMLNCQLEIEGRTTFACKPEMTLKQCTIGMDSQMHQIYHYMTHRAVGICSALKQIQFRAMSEMSVNRLMEATQTQLTAMHEALKNQKRLNEMELENMKEFKENDGRIRDSQIESLEKLKLAESLIDESLLNLQMDLELRQKSEAQLGEIEKVTQDISVRLVQHSSNLHEEHEKLLKEVDAISVNLQKNNLELLKQYNETLEFLESFKSVMFVLSSIATNIKSYIDNILATLHEAGLELSDQFIASLFLNLVYFTSGMIFLLFINVQGRSSKFLLIGLFLFNNIAAYGKAAIELFPFNIFIWLCYLVLKLLGAIKQRYAATKFTFPKYFKLKNNEKNLSETDESDSEGEPENPRNSRQRSMTPVPRVAQQPVVKIKPEIVRQLPLHSSYSLSAEDSEMSAIFRSSSLATASIPPQVTASSSIVTASSSSIRPVTPMSTDRPMTPAMRRVLNESISQQTPDRSATPFQNQNGRVQCQGITAKGAQCRNAAVAGSTKCRLHNYN